MTLIPCTECARHVRASEILCPFCAASIDASARPRELETIPLPPRSSGRAQIMSFRARAGAAAIAAAIGTTACGGSPAPLYGSPPVDSGPSAADSGPVASDAGADSGLVAMYGGPPDDAGTAADAGIDAASAALYGGPPAHGGES